MVYSDLLVHSVIGFSFFLIGIYLMFLGLQRVEEDKYKVDEILKEFKRESKTF